MSVGKPMGNEPNDRNHADDGDHIKEREPLPILARAIDGPSRAHADEQGLGGIIYTAD